MNTYCIKSATGTIITIHRDRAKAQQKVDEALGKGKYTVFRSAMGTKSLKDYIKELG